MCHVTKCCSVIGPRCTVQYNMARIHSLPDPFVQEVGLARETRPSHMGKEESSLVYVGI